MKLILKKNVDWSKKYGFVDRYSSMLCKTGHAKMLRCPDVDGAPIITLYDLGNGKYQAFERDFEKSFDTKKILIAMEENGDAKMVEEPDSF